MRAKKIAARAAKLSKEKSDSTFSNLKFIALDIVRMELDAAIKVRRTKDEEIKHRLKELLDFNSIDTFRILGEASKESGNALAGELAAPAMAVIDAIWQMAIEARAISIHAKRDDWQEVAGRVTEQLDFALALILRVLGSTVKMMSQHSKNTDLLCEALSLFMRNGTETADLIERFQELFPDDGLNEDGTVESGSFPDQFAWDTYLRVAALEKMVNSLPKHLRTAARQMNAWPMLRYYHNDRKKKFEQIAKTLELGINYPLAVSKRLAWRPDTPLVQYLDRLVCRLYAYRSINSARKKWGIKDVKNAERIFMEVGDELMNEDGIEAICRGFSSVQELTKDTAELWANMLIMPYIMATDAKTPETCDEPALKAIWKQKGVRSVAKFESRLTPKVVRVLQEMAR